LKGGSSPHTRGALPRDRRQRPVCRIIPAYAGSTSSPTRRRSRMADHPRIRGEHLRDTIIDAQQKGSSPHTRGALRVLTVMLTGRGIIPAYAGSTGGVPRDSVGAGDHPRIRGEHCTRMVRRPRWIGSSPHTRGAPHGAFIDPSLFGIIPAYAGSTFHSFRGFAREPDHPRIRGEHERRPPGRETGAGSSPHTRGAPRKTPLMRSPRRIIPAYAGSTAPR